MRRLRRTEGLRDLVRETELSPSTCPAPLRRRPARASASPWSRCRASSASRSPSWSPRPAEIHAAGVPAVLLFGIPAAKDEVGTGAYDDEGIVQMAVRALKEAHPDLTVITDVCLCEYTSHGHCGFVRDGEVDNDLTVELLAKTAISHAEAGADVVAPSRHDGRADRDDPLPARRGGPLRHGRSSPTPPSTPPPSTARSARPPSRRPSSATAAATRWIRPTRSRRCARRARPRGGRRRGDGQAGAATISTSSAGSRTTPAPRLPPTTSPASTRC